MSDAIYNGVAEASAATGQRPGALCLVVAGVRMHKRTSGLSARRVESIAFAEFCNVETSAETVDRAMKETGSFYASCYYLSDPKMAATLIHLGSLVLMDSIKP